MTTITQANITKCTIFGYVLSLGGVAVKGTPVTFTLIDIPTYLNVTSSSNHYILSTGPVTVLSDATGRFQVDLIQGCSVDVLIPSMQYRRTIQVPNTSSVDLFSIP